MFSLIISIISIALVAALAAATVYFGGSAFNKGTAGAEASTFINSAQQVAGAFTMAATDGVLDDTVETVADLQAENYLAQVPTYKNASLTLDATAANYVTVEVSNSVCAEILNRANGVSSNTAETVEALADATVAPTTLYGCVNTNGTIFGTGAAGEAVAFYKVK